MEAGFRLNLEDWVMQAGILKTNSENEFIIQFDAIFKSLWSPRETFYI